MAELPPIKFADLAAALLARADHLVPAWLPGGVQRGHEWVCGGLTGGPGGSCSVNLNTGAWADFAADEQGGDLVSLYAAIHGLTMGKAALAVARDEGLEDVAGVKRATPGMGSAPAPAPRPAPPPAAPAPPRPDEGWKTMLPVPGNAPQATFRHHYRQAADIEHLATYMADGHLLGYVVRFRTSDGGKETLPNTWSTSSRDGASKWTWRQWDAPRPLYYPGGKSPRAAAADGIMPTVVLVEGEKKAGVLQSLLDAIAPGVYLVVSWPGGCKAWKKALWEWLAGCTVLLWPDCDAKRTPLTKDDKAACADDVAIAEASAAKPLLPDEKQPGMAAMLGIGALLRDTHACVVQMLPIPDAGTVADGWDCADAINTDGWDGERVLAFFGRAQPLVATPVDGAAADGAGAGGGAGGGGGKKIDGPADAEGEGAAPKAAKALPWWLKPYWDDEKERWLTSRKMVIAALLHDEALVNVLARNELSSNIVAREAWPWLHGKAGPMTNTVDLMLGQYLTDTYGLPSINRQAIMEAIETVAHGRPFHPVRDYLQTREWDGKTREDKWLIYVLGENPETLSPAMREYLAQVGRFILRAMVRRVMEPGCKFDYCPVFEGPGGFRKSTMVEVLASPEFFSDTHFDVGRGKEGQEQVQGLWVYEIAELSNFGKAEIGLIKAFITAKVDRYRPSYGRTVEAYARQCVLMGTTNERTYLRDRTGNRRFWPVPVTKVLNIEWLLKWRDQLFAEAYARFLEGAPYTPSFEDEKRLFQPMQESRLVETAVLSEMTHLLTRKPTPTGGGSEINELSEFVTIAQMARALGVDAAKSNAGLEAQIRSWMEHEGWERVKKQINGVRAWGYARPASWPPEDADDGLDAKPAPASPTAPAASNGAGLPEPTAAEKFLQEADDAPF